MRAQRAGTDDAPLLLGPRAEGLPGDLRLSNGLVVALMDDIGLDPATGLPRQHRQAPSGGTLLDFAPEGGLDGFLQAVQVIDGDPGVRVFYQTADISADGRGIEATGRLLDPGGRLGLAVGPTGLIPDLVVTTRWSMVDFSPALRIDTTVANQSGIAVQLAPLCDLVLAGGGELAPFAPTPGWGLDLVPGQAVVVPWIAFAGSDAAPTSYAVVPGQGETLRFEALADTTGALRAVTLGPPPGGGGTLNQGQQRTWARSYLTATGSDPSAVTAEVVALLGARGGTAPLELGLRSVGGLTLSREPSLAMEVVFERLDPARYLGQDGEIQAGGVLPVAAAAASQARDTIDATLPLGTYRITPSYGGVPGAPVEVTVDDVGPAEALLDAAAAVRTLVTVALAAADGAANTEPVRLTVAGLGATDDPALQVWGPDPTPLVAGNRAWTSGGAVRLELPEGAYRVIASRGPFAPIAVGELRVPYQDGLGLVLPADTFDPGAWRSIDPATASGATVPGGDDPADVAAALCAERIDLFVRGEDDALTAASPACEGQIALAGTLGTLDVPWQGAPEGDGWLLAAPASAPLPGAGLSAAAWIEQASSQGAVLTALLAPRAEGVAGQGRGLFAAWDFDRAALDDPQANAFLRATGPGGGTVLDIAAIEVLSPADPWNTQAVLRDWLALLDAGARLAPLASSHGVRLADGALGAARTLVLPAEETPEALLQAVVDGRTCVSSGPLIDLLVESRWGSAGPGETLIASPGDPIRFDINVRAADWVPVSRVRLLAESRELWVATPEEAGPVVVEQRIERLLGDERWFLMDAGWPDQAPEGDYAIVYPDMPSYALCAPIWIVAPEWDTGI
ncbi:MAG: hypothetical protein ABIO70_21295 [Pseudomonadota bacterium]